MDKKPKTKLRMQLTGEGFMIEQKEPYSDGRGRWKWDIQRVILSPKEVEKLTKAINQ